MEHLTTPPANHSPAEDLALEILNLSRNTLLVKLRFLEPALCQLPFISDPEATYETDGYGIYYGFVHVLRSYRIQKELIMRDYLHTVLHCLFHHPFIGPDVNSFAWDLACDIAVENVLTELSLNELDCSRTTEQEMICAKLAEHVSTLTAEHIYRFLCKENLSPEYLETLRDAFRADEHQLWYHHSNSSDDSTMDETSDTDTKTEEEDHAADTPSSSSDEQDSKPELCPEESDSSALEELWDHIAEITEVDLETFSSKYGTKARQLLSNLNECTDHPVDYSDFLRKFTVLGEEMCLNDEDFDYIYYTYGLQLYHDIPLIEPLEYKELKKIREFVIAIDTSASVQGDLIESFVRQTWQILKQKETFFRQMRLYILQCDCELQQITLISNEDELYDYLSHIELKGGGGTDFRPVFHYIDTLQAQNKLTNLRGLLYFTDGDGIYPYHPTPYQTAFLFTDIPAAFKSAIPSWIITGLIDIDQLHHSDKLILKSID